MCKVGHAEQHIFFFKALCAGILDDDYTFIVA